MARPDGLRERTGRELVDHALFWQCNLAGVVGAEVTPEDGGDAIRAAIAGQ